MNIKSAKYVNLLGFSEVEVSFDQNVTYLVGKNGSGKTTAGLTGIWFVLQGIAEKAASKDQQPIIGDRFRFIGPNGSSARGSIVIHDESLGCDIVVNRRITESGTTLSFEAPPMPGLKLDQKWLNSIFDSFMLNPSSFENLPPREQAIALGIDLKPFDDRLAELKTEYTVIGREISALGKPVEVEPAEMIDVRELSERLQKAIEFNQQQTARQMAIQNAREQVKAKRAAHESVMGQIRDLQKRLGEIEGEYNQLLAQAKALPAPLESADLGPIQQEIARANSTNERAMAYRKYQETISRLEKKNGELAQNKKSQESVSAERTEAIRSMKLPFENLSVDKDGNLQLEGKFIRRPFFSSGELKIIILALAVSRNPRLRYAFLQDFNLLDEQMQQKIIDFAAKHNVQLVIEYVHKTAEGLPNAIMLRDCMVVE